MSRHFNSTLVRVSSYRKKDALTDLLAYVSRDETLHPGEILCSGTVGKGCGFELGKFLQHADVVELEVDGMGVLRTRVLLSA